MNQNLRPCPGCGVLLPETAGSTHRYIGASPECWSAFGEVSGKEYGDFRCARVHGLSVDAYCAQHPGEPSLQAVRSVAVHLVGLFLQMERALDPEELYAVHKRMSSLAKEGRKEVFWIEPPTFLGEPTILYVLGAKEPDEHAERMREWARSVWEAWFPAPRDRAPLGGALTAPTERMEGLHPCSRPEKIWDPVSLITDMRGRAS